MKFETLGIHPDLPPLGQLTQTGELGEQLRGDCQQKKYALELEPSNRQEFEQALKERDGLIAEQAAALAQAREELTREVAKRQELEKELLHARHVQNIAEKISHLGTWEIDLRTGILNCSDEFFRICGLEPQSRVIDLEFTQSIVHPEDRIVAGSAIKAALEGNAHYIVEKRIVRPDGSIRHVMSQGYAFLDEQQQLETAIGSFLDITDRKHTEEALHQSHENLRRLIAHQEQAKEEEKKRIARELHDELGGLLTGMKAYITTSITRAKENSRQANELLLEAVNIADTALDAVHRIIDDLRPSVLDHLGIWEALRWYAQRVTQGQDIACTCKIEPTALAASLDVERSTTVFRVCQEALTNVVRHARASAVSILATTRTGMLIIEVEDNGIGFSLNQTLNHRSWGLSGMQERAHQLGGELKVSSIAGTGTTIQLLLPLE